VRLVKTLLDIKPETPDREIAPMIADQMLALTDAPFRFAINHDIRPPKLAACPVEYMWTRRDRCGIEWTQRYTTKKWLTDALLHGYTVYLMGLDRKQERYMMSISQARRRAEYFHRPKPEASDDDIPF
jgi:hypothetical protein